VLSPRWAWPPDKWERLSTVAGLVGEARTVLDVGGRGHELRRLLPGSDVLTLNVEEPADVVVPAGRLPYEADAFDVVTSCDVLEHIPAEERAAHVSELVRVAADRLVACFPAGSPRKDRAEQDLAARLDRDYGVRFDFLDEHLERGLPRASDIARMVLDAEPSARVTVWFQDGIGESDRVLVDAVRASRRANPMAAARVARAWVRRPAPALTQSVGPDNNRAYVVAEVGPLRTV
jgi:methyltransferase family protein